MEILPQQNRQGIIVRFSVGGDRFSFSPLKGGKWESKRDRDLVAAIGTKIVNDILAGAFDPTLEKYRHKFCNHNATEAKSIKTSKLRWLEIWDNFVASLKLSKATAADHYACVRAMIVKADNPYVSETDWLIERTDLAASTFNRRASMLQKCVTWAIEQKIIFKNPLAGVETRSQTWEEEEKTEAVKAPFNSAEVVKIIEYFYQKHPSYGPFVEFLLFSGVRTGEAVGLRWKDIDLEKRIVAIEQSVSRERGGYKKVAKRPKTLQSRRILKMSDRIYELFLKIGDSEKLDNELVFKSAKGCEIDHGNFRCKYWKPGLEQLEIPYRKPYATRHTLLSKALESGSTIPQVAAIAGHKDGRMILQHYGRVINQVQLPD
ncbi:site-specific integrase [Microcoleus sp. Pol11C1]|uniref:site-specific integrase n=1 Tax=unclassified Microcoleus TaxID=2642155 RepID=UPI002FCEE96B